MKKGFMRRMCVLTMSTLLMGSMTVGCGSTAKETTKTEAQEGERYKIGVFQYMQHPSLDLANKGVIKALEESGISYSLDQQNASGDPSTTNTISQKLVSDENDLIFAIATPAAQATAALTKDIPIVITAVTDPKDAGLVESNEHPNGNVTGTSDLNPVDKQIEVLKKLLPKAKRVGILYCSAESNSKLQAEQAREACEANGLEATDFTVSNSNEIQTVMESMVGKVDAIYLPTDNVIANAIATVAMVADENDLPIIAGFESNGVDTLATYSVNYEALGYKAGEMAIQILKGEKKVEEMPIAYLDDDQYNITIDDELAKKYGVDPEVIKAK